MDEPSKKRPPRILDHGKEEESRLQAGIAADPDTWEAKGNGGRRRGRPIGSSKTRITTMLDNDILSVLKTPDEKGWQTRLNAILRDALGLEKV